MFKDTSVKPRQAHGAAIVAVVFFYFYSNLYDI